MIIFRYLVKEVYGTLLAGTLILLLLLISNQFVHYLTQAASGQIPIRTVMQIMSIQIPLLLGVLLPLGLYIGILMAYGRLYVDREMTVLSACGLSKAQLLSMTLVFSLLICVLVALLTFWAQPKVESYKRQILIEAASASPLEKIFQGQFTAIPEAHLQFYAEKLSSDHQRLENVFVAQAVAPKKPNDPSSWNIVVAANGHQMINPITGDKFIVLHDGARYSGAPGQGEFAITQYQQYGVRIQPNALPADKRAETLSTPELWQRRHQSSELAGELQWRISLPLSVFILALLATALSKVDPRQGRYAQLFPAVLLYILYLNLLFIGKAWVKSGKIPPNIGLWWIHALMLLIALVLLGRFIGWGRIGALLTLQHQPKAVSVRKSA